MIVLFMSFFVFVQGRQWWSKSEEPWQTLACCMEIAQALRSPDPTKYVSHFPVHQVQSKIDHHYMIGRFILLFSIITGWFV